MAEIVEYLWDCPNCEAKKILGRHAECPSCGASVPSDDCYYEPPPNTPAVTDPALLKLANAGSNWKCPFCGGMSRRGDGKCGKCGGGERGEDTWQGDSPSDPFKVKREAAEHLWRREEEFQRRAQVRRKEQRRIWFATCGLVVAVATVLITFLMLRTSTCAGDVVGKGWSRTILVQSWGRTTSEGWQENLHEEAHQDPSGSFLGTPGVENIRGCYAKVRSHRQVYDGERCSMLLDLLVVSEAVAGSYGNGFGSRSSPSRPSPTPPRSSPSRPSEPAHTPTCRAHYHDEPVYDTSCTYDTWKWVTAPLKATGTEKEFPTWPEFESTNTLREDHRTEEYWAVVRYGSKTASWALSSSDYGAWKIGDAVLVTARGYGKVVLVTRE